MTTPSSPIDELLTLPPGEFIAARNRLAASLKKTDPRQASEVKALPKPSASTWAMNQIARREPKKVAAYLDASDALARAQSGHGGAEAHRRAYQEALAAQREALDRLVTAAQQALEAAGLPTNRTVLERVTNDLRWAVMSDESRRSLAEGRLLRDLEPPDFSALVERIPLVAQPPRPAREPGRPAPPEKAPTPRERIDQKRLVAVRTRLATARVEAQTAADDLAVAESAVADADRAVAAARRELAAAEKHATEAARRRESAEAIAARRTAEVERLSAELEALETD